MLVLWSLTPGILDLLLGLFCVVVSISGAKTIVKSTSLEILSFGGHPPLLSAFTSSSKACLFFDGSVDSETTKM